MPRVPGCLDSPASNKIAGYDSYAVHEAVRTLKKAEEIKDDSKFLKVVLKEMDKEADKTEKTANVIRNTATKLKSVFKGGAK